MPLPRVQRYVASELSHFVGRSAPDDATRFELLCQILRSGMLLPPEMLRQKRRDGTVNADARAVSLNHAGTLSGNDRYLPTVVCFCDIPVDDLYLHTRKYSSFGLAFGKTFLAARGACPVWYIPREGGTTWQLKPGSNETRGEMFDRLDETKIRVSQSIDFFKFRELSPVAQAELHRVGIAEPWDAWGSYDSFLFTELLPFLKFFDLARPEDDPENFYMEREWRVVGSVAFALDDVDRIFLPREYARRWRATFPEYAGQLTFM